MALLEYHHIDKGNERTPNYVGKLKNFLSKNFEFTIHTLSIKKRIKDTLRKEETENGRKKEGRRKNGCQRHLLGLPGWRSG